jgi:hypothetical protein
MKKGKVFVLFSFLLIVFSSFVYAETSQGSVDSRSRIPKATKIFYEAEHLYHKVGRPCLAGWSASTRDKQDFMIYGPYERHIPGTWFDVKFANMRIDNNTADNAVVCRLEIYNYDTGKKLWEKYVRRSEITTGSEGTDFISNRVYNYRPGTRLEFRVWHYAISQICIDYIRVKYFD